MYRLAKTLRSCSLLLALATLIAVPLAWDPLGGEGTLEAKRAVLELPAFLALCCLIGAATISGGARLAILGFDWALLAWIGVGAASQFWATNPEEAAKDSLMLVAAAAVSLALRPAGEDERGARRLLWLLPIAGILAGLFDLAVQAREGAVRAASAAKFDTALFIHHNAAALLFAPLLALALGGILRDSTRRARILHAVLAVALAGLLMVLGSKAALIAIVLGPALWLLVERAAKRFSSLSRANPAAGFAVALALAAALVGAVLLPSFQGPSAFLKEQFNRFVTATDVSWATAYMRVGIWKCAFGMFHESPWLGVGLANFQYVLPRFDLNDPLKPHAHNQLVQVLAETGLVGLFLFAAALVLLLIALLRLRADSVEPWKRDAARQLGFAFAVIAIQSVFEPPLIFPFSLLLFFALVAIAGALACRRPVDVDLRRSPVLRFAVLPGVTAAIVLSWVPLTLAPLRQTETLRAANAHAARGDLDGAASRYALAARQGFDHWLVHRLLGDLEQKRQRFEPALAEFRRAAELFPNYWLLHLSQGICWMSLDRPQAALQAFERARSLYPSARELPFWIGCTYLKAGRYDEAIETLSRYRDTVEENVEVLRHLGDALYERTLRDLSLADAAKAHEIYQRYVAIGGPQGTGWINRRIEQLGHWLRIGKVELDDPKKN